MGRERDEGKTEYDLDRLIQSSYGLNDDQILERMKVAEETVDDSQIPPEPEDGFQQLWREVEARRLEPHFAEEYGNDGDDGVEREGGKKRRGLKPILKVALIVGMLGAILAMTSVTVVAKRKYWYEQSVRENNKNDVAVDNEANEKRGGDLNSAYDDVYQKVGIDVLKLGYRPDGMNYARSDINIGHATLYFKYNNQTIYLIQQLRTEENSATIVSDRKEYKKVYNKWMDINISINRAITKDGEEFSVQLVEDDAYYYLAGIIDEKEFEAMVENLRWLEFE